MTDEKSHYIGLLSQMSDRYGNLLIELMNEYGAHNLQEITPEQAEAFYKSTVSEWLERSGVNDK